MKTIFLTVSFLLLFNMVFCQKTERTRVENDYGYKIVEIDDKYIIEDSMGNRAIDGYFDDISLESIYSWGKKRNSFTCKRAQESYLISPDCQAIMSFDSILVLANREYICNRDDVYILIDDDFKILFNDLDF